MKLLILDTHIWLWLMEGQSERFSQELVQSIQQAANIGQVGISAISIWEIGMLEAKERIHLSKPCMDWVSQALSAPGVNLLPLTPKIAIASSRLPGPIHGDPADRILVATTRIMDGVLVTKDKQLLAYGNQGFMSVMPG